MKVNEHVAKCYGMNAEQKEEKNGEREMKNNLPDNANLKKKESETNNNNALASQETAPNQHAPTMPKIEIEIGKSIEKYLPSLISNLEEKIKSYLHHELSEIEARVNTKLENQNNKINDFFNNVQQEGFLDKFLAPFSKKDPKRLEQKYDELKHEYKKLEKEHDKCKTMGNKLNKEYNQFKKDYESLEKEINKLESQTKDLARELKDKENKLHQEKIRATSLENDKEHLKKTLNQQENEIKRLDSDLNYTKSELKATQNDLQTTKDNLKDTQQELQDTTETLKNTTSLLKNTEQNLFALEQQHENLRKEFFVNLYEGYKQLDSDFKKCFLTIKDNNAINFFKTLYAPNVLGNFYEQIKARAKKNEDITPLKAYFEKLFEVFTQDFNLERLITQQGDRYESSKHVSIGASGMSGNPIKEVLLLGFKDSTKTYQSLVKI
ncbi:hypothetical protein [Helicobacter cetorum]|uniref:Viral A-type inclusion protein repeat protein n=1 Tax=Helicobacter cetorum (strain ATCC BAA-429 / MIT 00-7128) TaxID=182217 RepID=I0ENV9_HELC0|nr:hypothetical protein [Helicobacter cetorum]AFI04628.1 viral A-type inclusion protein repeat protein [Helicobacter cetorum MIT 00-7128]